MKGGREGKGEGESNNYLLDIQASVGLLPHNLLLEVKSQQSLLLVYLSSRTLYPNIQSRERKCLMSLLCISTLYLCMQRCLCLCVCVCVCVCVTALQSWSKCMSLSFWLASSFLTENHAVKLGEFKKRLQAHTHTHGYPTNVHT